MTKHYILHLDPAAKYEWDRCSLRDPITADRPAFAELIAEAVDDQSGSYLVAVNIEVQILEKAAPQSQMSSPSMSELSSRAALPQLQELVA
ncbi:hypothetical protein [Myxacorys almedinensis]|uniref:Uncharacterized protein n=1 Tax=Myxacorys almedinensis A TaxID=2690445 RepID=A0A8J8CKN6_9CYAN|nr:hypothetical protein [Myxacorys almedinensis]NDJ19729.1 hypothetical protein [Myxacorys almedinensis A]